MSEPFEPEILVLYCGHTVGQGDRLSEGTKTGPGFKARFIMMPCSSKVEVAHLVKLIEQGADGITIVACPEQQCQFLVGSARAEGRVRYTRILLDEAGVSAERVGMAREQGLSVEGIMALAEKRAEAVRPLGPNPMKSVA